MTKSKLTVVAKIKAKSGMEEQVREELIALVAPTRSEAGCINYNLHQAPDDKCLFLFYENWNSREDLEQHRTMPHLKAFRQKSKDLLDGPIEISLWETIA